MADWNPTHTIALREPCGDVRIFLAEIEDGVCYVSEEEAQGFASSDWTYDEDGLLFQGQVPIGDTWIFKHPIALRGHVPPAVLAASDRAWDAHQAAGVTT